ncbi:MAG: hypothetical protein KJ056_13105, partial [Acidimicrobiia bacterium]|nr:hypothetical protein [Acidimicrobiia bacterium]
PSPTPHPNPRSPLKRVEPLMADLLILDFEGLDESDYRKVNGELGVDPATGVGDWPAPMISHAAGRTDDGHLVVVEVWESRAGQQEFMDRLGPALEAGGVTVQPRVTWAHLAGRYHRTD